MSAPQIRSRTYPGVRWLEESPAEWEIVPLGYLTRMRGGCTPSTTEQEFWDGDVPWVTPKDMKCVEISDSIDHVTEEALTRTTLEFVERDAILVVVRGMILAHSFPVAITRSRVTINQDMKALICSPRLLPRFALWTLIGFADVLVSLTDESAHGTRKLDASTLAHFPIALPDISTQHQIASFLDRETAKIDRLIAKKRELLELLEEKRQALISRCVTKGLPPEAARAAGLDPHPQMKASGIDAIGVIPTHWCVERLDRLTDPARPIMYGIVLPGPDVDEGVWIVKGGNCEPGRLKPEFLARTTFEIEARYERSRLQRNDLVYAIRGSYGAVEMVPEELEGANLTQDAARVAPHINVNGRWLLHALRSRPVFARLDARATGASVKGVNIRDLKRAVVPMPPRTEQDALAEYLDTQMGRLHAIGDKITAAIERLQEYRTALITAAVTGKIDVRDRMPDVKDPGVDDPDAVDVDTVAETD